MASRITNIRIERGQLANLAIYGARRNAAPRRHETLQTVVPFQWRVGAAAAPSALPRTGRVAHGRVDRRGRESSGT